MFALLARGVWNTDLDSFPLWINLNECPTLWEAAVCQAGRSPSKFSKAFTASPHSTAQTFFMPQ